MADVKWIKLSTDMFDDEKIDFIQSLPEGDALLVIWVRLLTMAGKCNADGYIYLTENIPYNEDILSFKFKKPINIVKLAMQTFQNLNMIEINDRGIELVNWSKYQSLEGLDKIKEKEQARIRKQKQRDKSKKIEANSKTKSLIEDSMSQGSHVTVTGTPSIIEEEREIDIKNIEIEIDIDNKEKEKEIKEDIEIPLSIYLEIIHQYNRICKSLPKVTVLDFNRKCSIDKCWSLFGNISVFISVFSKAEESDFLSGKSDKWKGCNFDWLVAASNMTKVLEGNYDNPKIKEKQADSFNGYEQREYDYVDLEKRLLGW